MSISQIASTKQVNSYPSFHSLGAPPEEAIPLSPMEISSETDLSPTDGCPIETKTNRFLPSHSFTYVDPNPSSKKRRYSEIAIPCCQINKTTLKSNNGNTLNFSSCFDGFPPNIEAILNLEKIERALASNDLNADDNIYFTPVTKKKTDPNFPFSRITILTEKLEPHFIPLDASDKLRSNLKTARKIVNHVRGLVPFSSNFLQRSRIFSKNFYQENNVKTVQETFVFFRNNTWSLTNMQYMKEILKYKIGNCEELSLVGLFQDKNILCVHILHGDHVFLIVGSKTQNPSDYKNLGPDAVICDPWTRSNYPASMLEEYLFSYAGGVKFNEVLYTKVKKFSPSTQCLSFQNF